MIILLIREGIIFILKNLVNLFCSIHYILLSHTVSAMKSCKLITDDPDMDLDDYAINVFEAASIDGKLFQIIPCFNVETVIGSANYMSGYENWMVDDFLALDEELKASGAHMFDPFATREIILGKYGCMHM